MQHHASRITPTTSARDSAIRLSSQDGATSAAQTPTNASDQVGRPGRSAAEAAVRTLLAYVGEDPNREGLLETPARVVRAYDEFFAGYGQDPEILLARTFEGYDEMVVVRDIDFSSHCEHHMVSFRGRAHVGYLPDRRVVGLSKLARVVEVFGRRLQIQEKMTAQIAKTIERVLQPKGVAVVVEATHDCMGMRGVRKPGSTTVTSRMTGAFREHDATRREFLSMIRGG